MSTVHADHDDADRCTHAHQRPATRAARLSAIEEALIKYAITSQSQLSQVLGDQGIEVTQATLSRDLDEIHASKQRLRDGRLAYVVNDYQHAQEGGSDVRRIEQQLARVLSGLVTSVAVARNLIVVHTPSGAAQYVASVIDKQSLDDVLGTIAGDDTVMVIGAHDHAAQSRARWLLDLASGDALDEKDCEP